MRILNHNGVVNQNFSATELVLKDYNGDIVSSRKNTNSDDSDNLTTDSTTNPNGADMSPASVKESLQDSNPAPKLKGIKKLYLLYFLPFWRSAAFTLGVVSVIFYVMNSFRDRWALYVGTFLILYPICSLYFFKKKLKKD
ncbi:hypothetical protein FCS83_04490 [Oenococcus sp. UCMA 17063]|nr:hypothetical protein [Oenococcus sp. UCMA 17063]